MRICNILYIYLCELLPATVCTQCATVCTHMYACMPVTVSTRKQSGDLTVVSACTCAHEQRLICPEAAPDGPISLLGQAQGELLDTPKSPITGEIGCQYTQTSGRALHKCKAAWQVES